MNQTQSKFYLSAKDTEEYLTFVPFVFPAHFRGFVERINKDRILKTIAAFFDVDGTLFTGHVWRGMLKYFQDTRGVWPVRWFWYTHLPSYFLRKAKLISEERFRGPWGAHFAWLARGWDRSQLQGLYDWIANTYVTPYRREDTIDLLNDHNRQRHLTVLVSTGFTKPVSQYTSNRHSVCLAATRSKFAFTMCSHWAFSRKRTAVT